MYFTTKEIRFKTNEELDRELKLLYENAKLEPWHYQERWFGEKKGGGIAIIKFKGK